MPSQGIHVAEQIIDTAHDAVCEAQRGRVRQFLSLLDRLLGEPLRSIAETQEQQIKAHVGERDQTPRLAIEVRALPVGGGVDCQAKLELAASLGEATEMDQARADAGVTHLPATIVVKSRR